MTALMYSGLNCWTERRSYGAPIQVRVIVPSTHIFRLIKHQRSKVALGVSLVLLMSDKLVENNVTLKAEMNRRSSSMTGMEACVTCKIMSSNLRLTLLCAKQIGSNSPPLQRNSKATQSPALTPTTLHPRARSTPTVSDYGRDTATDLTSLCGWIRCPVTRKKKLSHLTPPHATLKDRTSGRKGTHTEPFVTRWRQSPTFMLSKRV